MHVCTIWRVYWFYLFIYWSRTNYRQVPIIANLHVIRERTRIFWPFFADDNNKWWQIRQQNLTFVSWLIKKKSGKTPLETIQCTSLYKLRGDHVNGAEMPVAIINSNNIADWCSNDRQILVTPSCFAVRPFLLTSLLINIYFPTYNKMAIIGTLPSRFSDKNQQLYKGSLIRACAYKLFIFPSKVSRLVTFKIMRHLKGCIWTT